MKRKTIIKITNKKVNEWLASIEDNEVRVKASQEVIVTGGSICSMLLNEPVNDFDIYFTSFETTQLVAEYYVKKFIETHPECDETAVQIQDKTNIKGETETRVCIIVPSEGIAGTNPDDEENEPLEQKEELTTEENADPYQPVFLSENAITLTDKIQIVIRFYGQPDKIHSNYDFAHAMSWYRHKGNVLELNPLALECLLSKTLIYKGSLYPICSIFRVRKFIDRGWKISAGELLKIMWQISEIELSDIDVLREQLTGVDAAYFTSLIEAIKEAGPEKLNSSYVSHVIDKIFQ